MCTETKNIYNIATSLLEETENSASNIKFLLDGFRKNFNGDILFTTKSDEELFSQVRRDLYLVTKIIKETKYSLARSLIKSKGKSKNEKIFPHPDLPNMRRNKLAEAINVLKSASDSMNSLTRRYKLPGEDDKIISNN